MCLEIVRSHDLRHQPGPGPILGDIPDGAAEIMVSVPPYCPRLTTCYPTPLCWRRGSEDNGRSTLTPIFPRPNPGGLLHGQTVQSDPSSV